jgi:hypothetical protein
MSENISVKTYLEIDVVRIIDRRAPGGDEVWMDMIDHHCFRGNDTMMIFERFWSQCATYDELLNDRMDDGAPYPWSPFTAFITKYLEDNGYFIYRDYEIIECPKTGIKYDGVLLNITW